MWALLSNECSLRERICHKASNVLVIVSFPCVGVWLNWILCQARILNVDPTVNVPQEREFSHHMNEPKWFIIL